MLKNILLDLDETIFDFKKAEKNSIKSALNKIGVEATDEMAARYSEINLLHWKMLERGEIERKNLKRDRFKMFLGELGVDFPAEEMHKIYESFLASGHYYIEGAEELLKHMHERYRVYIVSNGSISTQKGRIGSSNIRNYIDDIFISEEVGFNKPDKRFYEKCFKDVPGFSKEESLVIGDSLSSDILGGINYGVRTLWLNRFKEENKTDIVPDYEVNSINEICDILKELSTI